MPVGLLGNLFIYCFSYYCRSDPNNIIAGNGTGLLVSGGLLGNLFHKLNVMTSNRFQGHLSYS